MWDKRRLQQLKESGKIKGFYCPDVTVGATGTGGRKVARHFSKKSKGLDYIAWNLLHWCNSKCLGLEEEYRFHEDRKWRFDWAVPGIKLAIEFEGGIFDAKGGHTRPDHFTKDTDKYNSAQKLGWTVLRYTALNYTNLRDDIEEHLKNWKQGA